MAGWLDNLFAKGMLFGRHTLALGTLEFVLHGVE